IMLTNFIGDQLTSNNEHFLVGKSYILAATDSGECWAESERSNQRRHYELSLGMCRYGERPLAAVQNRWTLGPNARGQLTGKFGGCDRHQLGFKTPHLFSEQLQIVPGCHCNNAEALREAPDEVKRSRANRTSRAEDREGFHQDLLDFRRPMLQP